MIDKEWIRVGWVGRPTLRHHLIAFTPMILLLPAAMILEKWSYATGATIIGAGMLLYVVAIIWIWMRALTGLGYFSSRRSDRVAKRLRRQRESTANGRERNTPPNSS